MNNSITPQTLQSLYDNLGNLLKEYPNLASMPVIYSDDVEGNNYRIVNFEPIPVQIDDLTELDLELVGFCGEEGIYPNDCNAVIIN